MIGRRPPSQHGVRGRPTAAAVIDAMAVLTLTVVAMTVLSGTFDGRAYLLTAAVGALAGIGSAALVHWLRLPGIALAVPVVAAAFLLGPPTVLHGTAAHGVPDPTGLTEMWDVLVGGWKELLTTLPPVDGTGRLTAMPFALSLISSAVGMLLARRLWYPHLPLVGPAAGLGAAIVLGLAAPGGIAARALVFLVIAVAWGAARRQRLVVATGGGRLGRAVTAAVLLAVATGAGAALAPGAGLPASARTVLRDTVVPPLDLSTVPSPLSDFRRFRPVWKDLADQVLLTVHGLPSGTLVRLATVDAYAGTVWAAGQLGAETVPGSGVTSGQPDSASQGRFQRVGSRIAAPRTGTDVAGTVTIGRAYASTPDLRVWVPSVGEPTRLEFTGSTAAARSEDLRFNPVTGAALVLDGLSAGDTYLIDAVVPANATPTTLGALGTPTATTAYSSVVAKYVTTTPGGSAGPLAAVKAVATRLRTTGAYTDGAGRTADGTYIDGPESVFLAGHNLGRLSSFLDDTEPAGNDEQYAAALALAADHVGLPSRVVLGAVPDATGAVHGRDVRAYVEVQVDADTWWTIPPDEFIPSRSKLPEPRRQTEEDRSEAAIVPPPNEQRPPSSLEGFALDTTSSSKQRSLVDDQGFALPPWAVLALKIAGFPLTAVLLWTLALALVKAARRSRRSRAGTPQDRVAAAWVEVVDVLIDSGAPASPRHTRPELAAVATEPGVVELATLADKLTFGPAPVSDEDAVQAWVHVRRVRGQVSSEQRWRDRWRSAVSLRSLLPDRTNTSRPMSPSAVHRSRLVPRSALGATPLAPDAPAPEPA